MPTLAPPRRKDGVPILNDLPAYRADPLAFWLSSGEIAPVSRVRLGPWLEYWVLTDPDFIQHVMLTNVKNYPRERRLMKLNRMGGPELMFNTDKWEEWLWRRRLMQPAFHRKQIAQFADLIVAEANTSVDRWLARQNPAQVFELEPEMKSLTMRVIGKAMFSVDIENEARGFQEVFEENSDFVFNRAGSPLPVPLWVPTPGNRHALNSLARRNAMLGNILQAHLNAGDDGRTDLLDMLIAAKLEDSERAFTPQQLIGEMSGIVFAGHETTALTMTWVLYLLSQMPGMAARVLDEITSVLGGRNPTLADLDQMPFTEHVILETLRLYPAVYVTLRESDAPDSFGEYSFAQGTHFLVNIRGVQRTARLWESPNTFDPDRFTPERSAGRHKFAFMPFSGGPKKCLGDSLAMMEMQLVIPAILQRVALAYAGNAPLVEQPGFTLRPNSRVPVRIAPRAA